MIHRSRLSGMIPCLSVVFVLCSALVVCACKPSGTVGKHVNLLNDLSFSYVPSFEGHISPTGKMEIIVCRHTMVDRSSSSVYGSVSLQGTIIKRQPEHAIRKSTPAEPPRYVRRDSKPPQLSFIFRMVGIWYVFFIIMIVVVLIDFNNSKK